jgi:hypothetical protein
MEDTVKFKYTGGYETRNNTSFLAKPSTVRPGKNTPGKAG